jgi:hypothetical protein
VMTQVSGKGLHLLALMMKKIYLDGIYIRVKSFQFNPHVLVYDTRSVISNKSLLWKVKVPLKIKIFLFDTYKKVLHSQKVILQKGIGKRKTKCCFCSSLEIIQHLFFYYHFAGFIWNIVHITFGIQPPHSITYMFGSWLNGVLPNLMKSDFIRSCSYVLGNLVEWK